MQLYGDLARLLEHLVGDVREMDRFAGKLVATCAEIDLRVRENLRGQRRDRVRESALREQNQANKRRPNEVGTVARDRIASSS